jgi:hypothetical protein
MRRAALLLVLLAGCGGGDRPTTPTTVTERAQATPPTTTTPPERPPSGDDAIRRGLLLPDRVPIRASRPASAAQVRVVRGWLDALRAGHVRAAARSFSLPARFQNFSDLAIMKTPAQAVAVNRSLPCGAKFLRAGAAGHGFVVYEARLTERPGGSCGAGVGSIVRGAILIRGGKMVEWYRLPDRRVVEPGGGTIA